MLKIILRVVLATVLSLSVAFFAALPMAENAGRHDHSSEAPPESTAEEIPAVSEPWDVVDASKAEYGYSEMVEDLDRLVELGEGRFEYFSIGESLDGRSIYAAVLGNPDAEKQIVVSAGIHAREYLTPLLVMKQIEHYLYNYETGEYGGVKYSRLFEEYAVCILPMCNPDGIALAQEGVEALRDESLRETVMEIYSSDKKSTPDFSDMEIDEYLKYWKANARGVDLNRNFDTPAWESNNVKRPCFADCRGDSPLSEPESRALAEYVESLTNPVCSLAIHSRGEIIYFDCGQEDPSREQELAELVSRVNGYAVRHTDRGVAAFDDWCVIEKNIPSVTVETGYSAFPLPIEEFEKIWNDNRDLWAAVAACGKY